MQLLRHPAHDLTNLFWYCARIPTGHLCNHLTVGIALDKLYWNREVQQTSECFTWHWARDHITPDHDLVYFCLSNILEYCLKCWKVPMNIIDCCNTHNRP